MKELIAVGVESGIGSMLVGAKQEGFKVMFNIESRKNFRTGTFEYNFPTASMVKESRNMKIDNIDLLMSHPSCGKFSSMGWANSSGKKDISNEHSSFLSVIDSINYLGPRFFLIDNLPRALEASPLVWWAERLPDYKLNVEMVHNYAYGNVQLKRDRIFIMGWKKEEDFVFIPGEIMHNMTVQNVLHDLVEKQSSWNNHNFFPENMKAPNMNPLTIKEAKEFFKGEPEGHNPKYYRDEFDDIEYVKHLEERNYPNKGELQTRIGTKKLRWLKHGQTITGGLNIYHPLRYDPLTCRERARLMGLPDDFVFIWNKPEDEFKQGYMGAQTGKAVPVGFPRYFSMLVKRHINGESGFTSGNRFVFNDIVKESKIQYCKYYGSSPKDCMFCAYKNICKIKQ